MSERRDVVLNAPIGRAIWSLAWPMLIANELETCVVGAELFWLGRLIGESGLVVESLYRPFGLMIAWFFASTTVGSSALVSRSVGASDGRGLQITTASMTLTMALCAAVVAVVVPFSPQIAGLLAGDASVQSSMLPYLLAMIVAAVPAGAVLSVLLEVTNATGETRFTIARIVIDLAFITITAPLLMEAGLGIAGPAISIAIAEIGLTIVLWVALRRRRVQYHLGDLEPGAWRPQWGLWRKILGIGVPVQVGRVAMYGGQIILIQLVAREGGASVAGYGIATALLLFGATATGALAQGGGIVIGQALGAGLHDRARSAVLATLLLGWCAFTVFIAATFFARPVILLFSSDPGVLASALHALAIVRWGLFGAVTWQILLACFSAYQTTVRAGIVMVFGEAFGVALAFAWPGSPLDSVCAAFVGSNLLKAGALCWLYFRAGPTASR